MTTQTDVLSSQLHQTGFIVNEDRCRIKAVAFRGTSTEGTLELFATGAAPASATYTQLLNTVTITKVAHGLSTGNVVGIGFIHSGGAFTPQPGNFEITVVDADTFTVPQVNAGTVLGTNVCYYVFGNGNRWIAAWETEAGDTSGQYFLLPGEGVLARERVYALMNGVHSATVFYG